MISVKHSEIPAILHEREFFKSLDENDDDGLEIAIPQEAGKLNIEINNNSDLLQRNSTTDTSDTCFY